MDLRNLLAEWPYDSERNIRIVHGDDGRDILQLRIDQGAFQGVVQMNLDGRPDGRRPHDRDFALDHYQELLAAHRQTHDSTVPFRLSPSQCAELFDESHRVYERYVFLLKLHDFPRVVRDTERNMALFRFVHHHAAAPDDRMALEKWWPYILRIHAEAKTQIALREEDRHTARQIVQHAVAAIQALPEVAAPEFIDERRRSLQSLAALERKIGPPLPASEAERLDLQLRQAVAAENFEQAALIRDRLRALQPETAAGSSHRTGTPSDP